MWMCECNVKYVSGISPMWPLIYLAMELAENHTSLMDLPPGTETLGCLFVSVSKEEEGILCAHHNPKKRVDLWHSAQKTHVIHGAARQALGQSKLWSEESFNSAWFVSPETGIIWKEETTHEYLVQMYSDLPWFHIWTAAVWTGHNPDVSDTTRSYITVWEDAHFPESSWWLSCDNQTDDRIFQRT